MSSLNSFLTFTANMPGELISQDPDFAPAGKLLPQDDNPDVEAAAESISCPEKLIRPKGFPCFVSGNKPSSTINRRLFFNNRILGYRYP